MKINDFMLCTFSGDTQTPPLLYAAEITAISPQNSTFACRLADSGLMINFKYAPVSGPWNGTAADGNSYSVDTHDIYTPAAASPYKGGAAVISFADGKRYLCYTSSVDPSTDIQVYGFGSPSLCIVNDVVTKSNWDAYPVGTAVKAMEACELNTDLPGSTATTATTTAGSTGTAAQAAPPFFFADVYSGGLHGRPDWNALAAAPGFCGAIIKVTQGKKGDFNDGGWFKTNWQLLKDAGGSRYGNTWFRGAYLFLNLWEDGAAQADNYLDIIDAAGGWGAGDMIPIIDVEMGNDGSNGGKRNPNNDCTTQQIIKCATDCANRLRSRTSRKVMLYGRGAMRDRGITDKMGCDVVWNPAYTATMVTHGLEAWTLDDIVLWQYCGDGVAAADITKFPREVPGFGKVDISIYIEGKNKPVYQNMITRLGIGTA